MTNHNDDPFLILKINSSCICALFKHGIFMLLLLIPVSGSYGQTVENIPKRDVKSNGGYQTEGSRRIKIGFISVGGVGFNHIPLAETTNGEKVTISAGGGIGAGFDVGYLINHLFELSAAYIYKSTDLSIYAENASGNYEHGNFNITGKFISRIKKRVSLNYGGGLGLFNAGSMDLDFSKVPSGTRNVYKYKTAFGFHVLGEFQFKFVQKWSITAGCTLYGVNYTHLKSFQVNSVSIPVEFAGSEFQELKGSGADFYGKISFYF